MSICSTDTADKREPDRSLSDPGQYPGWFIPLGIIAMSAFTVLILVSLRPVREKVYELFYYVHVLTVL